MKKNMILPMLFQKIDTSQIAAIIKQENVDLIHKNKNKQTQY